MEIWPPHGHLSPVLSVADLLMEHTIIDLFSGRELSLGYLYGFPAMDIGVAEMKDASGCGFYREKVGNVFHRGVVCVERFAVSTAVLHRHPAIAAGSTWFQ